MPAESWSKDPFSSLPFTSDQERRADITGDRNDREFAGDEMKF